MEAIPPPQKAMTEVLPRIAKRSCRTMVFEHVLYGSSYETASTNASCSCSNAVISRRTKLGKRVTFRVYKRWRRMICHRYVGSDFVAFVIISAKDFGTRLLGADFRCHDNTTREGAFPLQNVDNCFQLLSNPTFRLVA
jgi:hypothetical protein